MGLFLKSVSQYRASAYEIARSLLKSRDTQRERAQNFQQRLNEQTQVNEQLRRQNSDLEQQLELAVNQRIQVQQELQRLREQPIQLPNDPPIRHHFYGPKMISLCIHLAKRVGLRASMDALKIVLDWLAIKTPVPCWTTVRTWMSRMGVDRISHSLKPHEDWIWMADHSDQVGQEKVLTILGIRASNLPPPGETLRHQDVHVLAVVPGTQWKREDVAEQYKTLANKIGTPKMLLTDGAVELRESAQVLEKDGKKPFLARDMKHFAANALERMIGNTESFKGYISLLGSTRSLIQQTELSHFMPPSQKPKARFMNLAETLRWGEIVLWQLNNSDSQARQGIDPARMELKLGWLRDYCDHIAQWRRIESVISASLTFINTQGFYRGASNDLRLHVDRSRRELGGHCELSDQMAQTLIEFVSSYEPELAEGQRGWLSTEILESAFGLYKAFEGQHSKGGFTSLLASFGCLLQDCSAGEVRECFRRTSVKGVKNWVASNLGQTLTSKKQSVYRQTLIPTPCS